MEKIVSARHFHLRPAAKTVIEDRLTELAEEFRELTSARVILDVQKGAPEDHFQVEVILHGRGLEIESRGKGGHLLTAVNAAVERAERQLRRHVGKRKNHHHRPMSEVELEQNELAFQGDLESEAALTEA